jgi:hypothetical protein
MELAVRAAWPTRRRNLCRQLQSVGGAPIGVARWQQGDVGHIGHRIDELRSRRENVPRAVLTGRVEQRRDLQAGLAPVENVVVGQTAAAQAGGSQAGRVRTHPIIDALGLESVAAGDAGVEVDNSHTGLEHRHSSSATSQM